LVFINGVIINKIKFFTLFYFKIIILYKKDNIKEK